MGWWKEVSGRRSLQFSLQPLWWKDWAFWYKSSYNCTQFGKVLTPQEKSLGTVRRSVYEQTKAINTHSLEKEMATHSSILAWKNPWTEESGRLKSMGLHDWACVHEGGGRWVASNKLVELKKKEIPTPLGEGPPFAGKWTQSTGMKRILALSIKCKKNTTKKFFRENELRLSDQG